MKKRYVALFGAVLLLITLFAGCRAEADGSAAVEPLPEVIDQPELPEEPEVQETTETPDDPFEEATPANVQVHVATDELLSQFDSYHEFVEDPDGIRVVVTTDAPVSDFAFTELRWDEDVEVVGHLYTLDTLLPETPFVITWMPQCAIPNRGISFTDTENVFREFSLAVSGYDGSLILSELAEQICSTPRTTVIGILDASELVWDAIYVTDMSHTTHRLSPEDAEEALRILTTMEAEEVLAPAHHEAQQSDPRFVLSIRDGDKTVAEIQSTETGQHFFRFTGTTGSNGDPGYVIGESEALGALLSAYF
ncbi:MAG: hypothetical protein FWE28_05995 [Oscillospiraceae bacterium]|nr:hypothetical protein [Oscillospiraceae bacterium]